MPHVPNPSQPSPIAVRIPEAVKLSGLSRSVLYELIKNGEIEIAKVGRSTLVLVESLHALIEKNRQKAA